jgi:hypothetical protein
MPSLWCGEHRGSVIDLVASAALVQQFQFEFGFCAECFFSRSFIMARACNSASSRDPMTTLPFISTPVG